MSKWTKFDKLDKSTWPKILDGRQVSEYVVLRNDQDFYCVGYRACAPELRIDWLTHDFPEMEFDTWSEDNVTHWKYIDKPEDL